MMYGETIRKYRKEKGLTRPELAKLAGLSVSAIRSIERGERDGRPETLEKILKALGLQIVVCELPPSRSQQAG